jgi:hypothetical protein
VSKSSRARSTRASASALAKSLQVKAKRSRKPAVLGRRVGTKKRDMRWEAPDGIVWASRFEYEVYTALKEKGVSVERTEPGKDTLKYHNKVRSARCITCGSCDVVQDRTYTPDLLVGSKRGRKLFYIEAKGYLRAERRSLLRAFRQSRPEIDMRLVVQKDHKITKTMTIVQWAERYLKIPVHVWNGDIPDAWK